jgi:serpin B
MFAVCKSAAGNGGGSFNIVKVKARDLLPPNDEASSTALIVASGANDFAFRLGAALVKNAGDTNFICSPYSIWLPLAALVNATDDQYKAALTTVLGASEIAEADINKAASRMLYSLTKMEDKKHEKEYEEFGYKYYNPLRIANAVFVDKNVTLRRDFAQTFMDFYRGSSINVDFTSKNAVDAVNKWASDNTDGLITNLIKEFDPRTVAAIANAIYFSDRWSWEFDPAKTKEDVFHANGGDSRAFFMLREGDDQSYYEDDKMQAIRLWFVNNGSMYIILPKNGDATVLLSSMTNDYFKKISFNRAKGKLLLPRFSVENDISGLKEALISMGVPLFVSEPLTGLINEKPLLLTAAMQKALIKVDEKGTTAAAVTEMGMAAAGIRRPSDKTFEMICDRPFVFILCEYTHDGGDQILFTGIVNKP